MKITLVTFLYEATFKYIPGLIENINEQSKMPTEVIFFCDETTPKECLLSSLEVTYKLIPFTGSPLEIRVKGLEYLKGNKSDVIIFQDSDDLMSFNRIEDCSSKLMPNHILINDLDMINDGCQIIKLSCWSRRLMEDINYNYHDLIDKNFVGFGNTTLSSETLNQTNLHFNNRVIAGDWFVFFQIIYSGNLKINFSSQSSTKYRIHSANLAGLEESPNKRSIKNKGVKLVHFQELNNIGIQINHLQGYYSKNINNLITSPANLLWWEETGTHEDK